MFEKELGKFKKQLENEKQTGVENPKTIEKEIIEEQKVDDMFDDDEVEKLEARHLEYGHNTELNDEVTQAYKESPQEQESSNAQQHNQFEQDTKQAMREIVSVLENVSTQTFNNRDYDLMVQEGLISNDYAEELKVLDKACIEAHDKKTDQHNIREYANILNRRNAEHEKVRELLDEKKEEIRKEQREERNEIFEAYIKKAEVFQNIATEAMSAPGVEEHVKEMAQQANKEFDEKIEKKWLRLFKNINDNIDFLANQQEAKMQKLIEITGNQNIVADVLADKGLFQIRNIVKKAIEDGLVKDEGELMTGLGFEGKKYFENIKVIADNVTLEVIREYAKKGDQQAIDLMVLHKKISDQNIMFQKIVGKKWDRNRTSLRWYYHAFEKRRNQEKEEVSGE